MLPPRGRRCRPRAQSLEYKTGSVREYPVARRRDPSFTSYYARERDYRFFFAFRFFAEAAAAASPPPSPPFSAMRFESAFSRGFRRFRRAQPQIEPLSTMTCVEIKILRCVRLNHRVDLHAIDATPA